MTSKSADHVVWKYAGDSEGKVLLVGGRIESATFRIFRK